MLPAPGNPLSIRFQDRFFRRAVASALTTQTGVEQVSHGVAENVGAIDHRGQANAGKPGQSRVCFHEHAAFPTEHPSPGRGLGWQSKAEEAQGRFSQDHASDAGGEDDEDGGGHIGKNIAKERSPGGTTGGFGGFRHRVSL